MPGITVGQFATTLETVALVRKRLHAFRAGVGADCSQRVTDVRSPGVGPRVSDQARSCHHHHEPLRQMGPLREKPSSLRVFTASVGERSPGGQQGQRILDPFKPRADLIELRNDVLGDVLRRSRWRPRRPVDDGALPHDPSSGAGPDVRVRDSPRAGRPRHPVDETGAFLLSPRGPRARGHPGVPSLASGGQRTMLAPGGRRRRIASSLRPALGGIGGQAAADMPLRSDFSFSHARSIVADSVPSGFPDLVHRLAWLLIAEEHPGPHVVAGSVPSDHELERVGVIPVSIVEGRLPPPPHPPAIGNSNGIHKHPDIGSGIAPKNPRPEPSVCGRYLPAEEDGLVQCVALTPQTCLRRSRAGGTRLEIRDRVSVALRQRPNYR